MVTVSFFRRGFLLFLILCSFGLFMAAAAQDEITYYDPITEIDLGVKELLMNVGETFVFPLTYKPAETPHVFLSWYADEVTVTVDPKAFSVTALAAGTTRILVESNAGFTFDFCDITVLDGTPVSESEGKAGSQMITLSDDARNKIEAKTVLNFLSFMENANLSDDLFNKFGSRIYNVTAEVNPGTVKAESLRAYDLGFAKALELPDLNAVSLKGTFLQILSFVEDNPDLVSIFEFSPVKIDKPVSEFDPDAKLSKSITLKSNVETITNVSNAHDKGFTGAGTVVAIIDTGLNKDHVQFTGRVVYDECMALSNEYWNPSCAAGSSAPVLSQDPKMHNHGSHVAGIAAGSGGIAPDAEIISINISVEHCEGNDCVQILYYNGYEIAQKLVELQQIFQLTGDKQIIAANYSLGDILEHKSVCDAESIWEKMGYDLMLRFGIIPVVCTQNYGYAEGIADPSCLSNAFRVGALDVQTDPKIASYSNHSPMVDILAPGTKIWSALFAWDEGLYASCDDADDESGRLNCYGEMSGTSMATPMITGGFALLRQAYPDLSVSQLESLIKSMSTKSARERTEGFVIRYDSDGKPYRFFVNAMTFNYDKPVLTFDKIGENFGPEPSHRMNFFRLFTGPVLPETGVNASVLPEKPADLEYKAMNWKLQIPSISANADIVEVPFRDDEYNVTWLGDNVGLLEDFPLPGQGTTVIVGHNHLNGENIGPFAMLQFVSEGDRIFIQNPDGVSNTYVVYANEKIAETDFSAFERIASAKNNAMVFITCEDERFEGGYANRRIVAAMPKK